MRGTAGTQVNSGSTRMQRDGDVLHDWVNPILLLQTLFSLRGCVQALLLVMAF